MLTFVSVHNLKFFFRICHHNKCEILILSYDMFYGEQKENYTYLSTESNLYFCYMDMQFSEQIFKIVGRWERVSLNGTQVLLLLLWGWLQCFTGVLLAVHQVAVSM